MSDDIDDTWTAPQKGHWRRDFRLGEWLTAPVTPSFATWFLPRFEQGFVDASIAAWGVGLRLPLHVLVNGWYYTNPGHATGLAGGFVRAPGRWVKAVVGIATMTTRPERLEAAQAAPAVARYDHHDLPAHRAVVDRADQTIASSAGPQLVALVDELSSSTGTLMLTMVEAAGFASKAELALATFYDRQLRSTVGGNHLRLLSGLTEPAPPPDHAVYSIDWSEPTAGERPMGSSTSLVHGRLVEERIAAESACRAALASDGKQLERFETTLAVAQRWVPERERIVNDFTSAWPALRRALLALGDDLFRRDLVGDPSDVFFLERAEVVAAVDGADHDLSDAVARRRTLHLRRSALVPPLTIGRLGGNARLAEKALPRYRSEPLTPGGAVEELVGLPASAGTASGRVRIVHDIDDFDRFEPGEVLVAPITAPGWEPLLAAAAAVVTDSGSVFAHASVIAREYGIPAVVGTNEATSSLVDGETVTVDGDRGVVVRGS